MSRLRTELEFQLFEHLDLDAVLARPRHCDHDRDVVRDALDVAARIADDKFAPLAARLDAQEPVLDGERVVLIPELKSAIEAYVEAGFLGAQFDAADGGLQMPVMAAQAIQALFSAANLPAVGYPFLTIGAANLEKAHADAEQQRLYMRPMIEGRFFGTMCLSEPQAGSSLADITTRATPNGDGTYSITGAKMWISGADHDLSENIIHHVLGKIPGGPPGVKGISLFIVPKYRLDADGNPNARNDVRVASLNHKMGYRGTVNAALNFGEEGNCVGYLIGEAHHGLRYMFHMMNEARIGVGMGAAALGLEGYYQSSQYARERLQGRRLGDKDPESPPVPIIEHADVRRMLLQQKAYGESALALALYCAQLLDEIKTAEDEGVAKETERLLDLLTPIAKSYPSEYCTLANSIAIQVLGGYGYTRDFPVERLYRDNRLNAIHEGTTGVQAIDLLGRKVLGDGGAVFARWSGLIAEDCAAASNYPRLAAHGQALNQACRLIEDVVKRLGAAAVTEGQEATLANASLFLDICGHIAAAWMQLRQACAAARALEAHDRDDNERAHFLNGKLSVCDYYFRWELPQIGPKALLLGDLDPIPLVARPEWL